MKYCLDQLCIEVTRKCNMSCAHCLRGKAQNLDVNTLYIDKLLQHVQYINTIVFTGGEPSLNVPAIEYTLQKCKELEISVGSFYIVTNGKADPLPLALACLKWYAYCDDTEDGLCGLALSSDMFHEYIDEHNEAILRGLKFFTEDKNTDFNRVSLINEGNAVELHGFNKVDADERHCELDVEQFADETQIYSCIYLSANGDIKTDCDVAYTNDNYTIGNLNKESFQYIIEMQQIEKTGVLPF